MRVCVFLDNNFKMFPENMPTPNNVEMKWPLMSSVRNLPNVN